MFILDPDTLLGFFSCSRTTYDMSEAIITVMLSAFCKAFISSGQLGILMPFIYLFIFFFFFFFFVVVLLIRSIKGSRHNTYNNIDTGQPCLTFEDNAIISFQNGCQWRPPF